MLHPAVFSTSALCHALGVRHAVMSPGSRNAPLTISFARNDKVKKWIIPDERTAGFVALGIAQETKTPVVLCCTSGTALLNYAPAIAEAYYREIPLIVLSADRPLEMIDQRDGQTIRQFGALKNHVKNSFQMPPVHNGTATEYFNKLIEGIRYANDLPKGPVHFNIPFKEPFYPIQEQKLEFIEFNLNEVEPKKMEVEIPDLSAYRRILILVGQQPKDHELSKALSSVGSKLPILVSPLNNLQLDGIEHADLFLKSQPELAPDLLITSGLSVLSKNVKNFIRSIDLKAHWHFDTAGVRVDTYSSKPQFIQANLASVLANLQQATLDEAFADVWRGADKNAKSVLRSLIERSDFSELTAFEQVLESIPINTKLHLGNSMPVRYADLLGVKKGIESFCNRGTSGIEGVTSTALGTAFVSDHLTVLLTGDLSFLYDRNAFFHSHHFTNLRLIVFNNQGGGIFRLIEGPSKLDELEEYFETRHDRTAEHICTENRIDYCQVRNGNDLRKALTNFFDESRSPKLLEVFTDPQINQRVYRDLRKQFV